MTEQEQIGREVLVSETEKMRLDAEERREEAKLAWERAQEKTESSGHLVAARQEARLDD